MTRILFITIMMLASIASVVAIDNVSWKGHEWNSWLTLMDENITFECGDYADCGFVSTKLALNQPYTITVKAISSSPDNVLNYRITFSAIGNAEWQPSSDCIGQRLDNTTLYSADLSPDIEHTISYRVIRDEISIFFDDHFQGRYEMLCDNPVIYLGSNGMNAGAMPKYTDFQITQSKTEELTTIEAGIFLLFAILLVMITRKGGVKWLKKKE